MLASLAPLAHLTGKLDSIAAAIDTGVMLARTTLTIGRQALAIGTQQLGVARMALTTLDRSFVTQQQLRTVAQQTLEQVRELNAKTGPPPPAVLSSAAARRP